MAEDKYIEWKEAWRDEHLKWICGFANTQGGVLEIERNDKGKAIGVENPSKLLKDLPNKIRDILGTVPEIDQIKEKSKTLIQIKIFCCTKNIICVYYSYLSIGFKKIIG